MKHVFFLASLTAVTVVTGSAGATVAAATSAPEVHRYVADGMTLTWGDAEDMSDLEMRHTPGAVNSATSTSDRKIGAAVLAAYRRSGLEQGVVATYATDYCTYSSDSYGKASFKTACAAHDACYSSSSTTPRLTCDNRFKDALNKACNSSFSSWWEITDRKACNGVAWTYYQAVRKLGKSHYQGKASAA